MQETTNLKLKKPDYSVVADIEDINANMDVLDNEVHKNTTAISNINTGKADKSHNHNNGADLTNVNASKLGGKSVFDFAVCSVISNGDFNNVTTAGLYTMRNCVNAPDGGNYYGLLVVKSDTGDYIEQMALKENTYKVFVRYCYGSDDDSGELNWYGWEEIGRKHAEKIRIFDVDGKTLKETDGINDVASIIPKQITADEARITGFDIGKYWFTFDIPNQSLKVPYADIAIRALSLGKAAVPADTGIVRNVEGIGEAIMNDPMFPTGYVTRTDKSPYSPINGREFHIMYFPSTQAYGTQIAIGERAFDGMADDYDNKDNSGKGLSIYIRSGQNRYEPSEDDLSEFRELGYTITADPSNENYYIAADWSDWVKINTTSQICQQAFSVSNPSTKRALSFSENDLDTVIKDIYQRILGLNYYTHPVTAGYKHIPSGGSTGQILKWSSAGTAQWAEESEYVHPVTAGYKHIPNGGSTGQILRWASDGTAKWGNESTYTHPTLSGYKHIPENGAWNNMLVFADLSGTAKWIPSPYTYRKVSASISYGKWYKVALFNFTHLSKNTGGSALINIRVYDNSGNNQTIVCRANCGGTSDNATVSGNLEVITSLYDGNKLFNKISLVTFNYGFISLQAAKTVSSLTINVSVDSSISEDRVDIKANDNIWDTTVDGDWIWSHEGNHYWTDYDI